MALGEHVVSQRGRVGQTLEHRVHETSVPIVVETGTNPSGPCPVHLEL